MVEGLPPARSLARAEPTNGARITLFEVLGQPADRRWKRIWHNINSSLPLDD